MAGYRANRNYCGRLECFHWCPTRGDHDVRTSHYAIQGTVDKLNYGSSLPAFAALLRERDHVNCARSNVFIMRHDMLNDRVREREVVTCCGNSVSVNAAAVQDVLPGGRRGESVEISVSRRSSTNRGAA